jgi:glycosyltransferase involved in cell wall biosynthesis
MTADPVGGVWTYALELARSLEPHGIEITLATMGQPLSANQKRAAKLIHNLHVAETTFRLEWMEEPWADVTAAGEWLLRLRDRVQPDIVHLNNYAHGALAWEVPTVVVGHSCVYSWWKAVHRELPPENWNRYRYEVTNGLRAANLVVAPSRWMLDQLVDLYGPFSASRVVPNGRDATAFHAGSKWPMVLCAGRLWDKGKNVAALTEIADEIVWPIYLAGEERFGPSRHETKRQVRYLGNLLSEELAQWMAQASIFAMPARYEPFGLTIVEAALSGCALILGDIPSLRENWDDAAVFVDPGDKSALQSAIDELAKKPVELRNWAGLAQLRAQMFNLETMARNYLDIYRSVCELSSFITH